MRRKITLVLSVMFIAIFLTACTTSITAEEYKTLENIASEVKNAEGEYQLPDGYKIAYADATKANLITVIKVEPLTGKGDSIRVTFDIAKNEPELVSIEQDFYDYAFEIFSVTFLVTISVVIVLSFVDFLTKKQLNK